MAQRATAIRTEGVGFNCESNVNGNGRLGVRLVTEHLSAPTVWNANMHERRHKTSFRASCGTAAIVLNLYTSPALRNGATAVPGACCPTSCLVARGLL